MIIISSYEYDQDGYFEIEEDPENTVLPETKRNVTAFNALDNRIIYEDRGVTYTNTVFEMETSQGIDLNEYLKLKRFIEKNSIIKVHTDIGVYEVFQPKLNYNNGRAKISGNISKQIY
jgi:hypothetical protein